jgi:hypothetical protein
VRRQARQLSFWLALIGGVVLVVGLVWDVVLHLADPKLAAYEGLSPLAIPAHLAFVTGCLLAILGVLLSMA